MGDTFVIGNLNSAKAGSYGIQISMDPSPVIIVAAFNKLGVDIRSFKEPLKRSIQQVIAPSIRKNFDSGGRPEPWAPLKPRTVAQKKYEGFGRNARKILKRKGDLQRLASTLRVWDIDGVMGEAKMMLPEEIFYGGIHQAGWETIIIKEKVNKKTGEVSLINMGDGGAVARPWALIQDEDADDVEKVFDTWLGERVDANMRVVHAGAL